MLSTIIIVALVAVAVWLYLGGPTPNLLPKPARTKAIITAWLLVREHVRDPEVRQKLDELLPLLLKDAQP